MSFDYGYVLPPTGPAENAQVREMFDDIKTYINASVPPSGSAPSDATYVTLSTNTVLTNERVLTAGTAIQFTDGGAGSTLTVTNTGVVSVTGTANQVIVSGSAGNVTFSLPQSIATTSDPTFRYLTVNHGDATDSGIHFTANPILYGMWVEPTGGPFATLNIRADGTDIITFSPTVNTFDGQVVSQISVSAPIVNLVNGSSVHFSVDATGGYSLIYPSAGGSAGEALFTDGSGNLDWRKAATIALDNLASTAVNASILPNAPATYDLGNTTLPWANVISEGIIITQASPGTYFSSFISSPSMTGNAAYVLPINDGTANQVLTTDGSGILSWGAGTGGGAATTQLDNLSAVAINASLLPGTDNSPDLGSASKNWHTLFVKTSIKIQESGAGTDTITIQAPSALSAGYTLTLPVDDGTANQVLTTDGSGVLSWGSGAAGGAANTALSNLASTAVNASIIPAVDNTVTLGSSGIRFQNVYTAGLEITSLTVLAAASFVETGGGTDLIAIRAPSAITSSYNLYLPGTQGGSDTYLKNDGSGNLSWASSGGSGTVNTGTAGRIALYPSTATTVDDVYVQNTKNIDIVIATQASRSADLEITIPNPGNAVTAADVLLSEGAQTINGNKTFGNIIFIANGTAAAPSLALSGSTTTGFYRDSAGVVGFSSGGVETHSFETDLNVGIGGGNLNMINLGLVGTPSIKFTGDPDTGFYHIGADNLGVSAGGSKVIDIKTTAISQPLQPCFSAFNEVTDTDVTGDNTNYTVLCDLENYDIGSNYNTSTGTFTAPVTGKYQLNARVKMIQVTVTTHTLYQLSLTTSNRSYTYNQTIVAGTSAGHQASISELVDMDAGDTAIMQIEVDGSSKTVDVQGSGAGGPTYFTGSLIN